MFEAGGDSCLSIFRDVYATGALIFPPDATVLEIGCAEADWMTPMLALRPDLHLTGIDWRACTRGHTIIRGDVLTQEFPPESFDVVVGVSSIEHIGLGHYDADPFDVDGDVHCMQRVAGWLKPGGWCYADVPYGDAYRVVETSHREYDEAALLARLVLPGLRLTRTWYAAGQDEPLRATAAPTGSRIHYVAALMTKES